MERLPTLFVSHGAPTLPLTDAPARRFLETLGDALPYRPRAVLAVSAHWETTVPTVNAVARNDTIHDFFGFPEALYAIRYPAAGSPSLADEVAGLLTEAGFACDLDRTRGLDHGAWVPLRLMFPDGDVPVVQLSVQTPLGPAHHVALGRALDRLAGEGVLVLGSGSFTHDLSEFRAYRDALAAPEPEWVSAFANWFGARLEHGAVGDLVDYRRRAPFGAKNHPTEEHLLPLFVALGAAGGAAPRAERLHRSVTHGVLRMDVYAFFDRRNTARSSLVYRS